MLLPHPESDLRLNLLVLGADILEQLKKSKKEYFFIETVLEEFLKKDEKRNIELFIYSLTFLFSIGLVEKKDYKIRIIAKAIPKQQEIF